MSQVSWQIFDETTLTPAGSGSSATMEVPAGARRTLVATNFVPIDLTTPGSSAIVTFNFSISGGLTGVASGTRPVGAGLFNSGANTASFADDGGYFFWINGTSTPSTELRRRLTTASSTSLLNPASGSFANMGTGNVGTQSGSSVNAATYTVSLQLNANASTGNLSFGLSNAAGVGITGSGLNIGRYTNPETTEVKTFDTFGFMFLNTSGSAATVTLDSVSLTAVPEPSATALLLLGAAGVAVWWRRRSPARQR